MKRRFDIFKARSLNVCLAYNNIISSKRNFYIQSRVKHVHAKHLPSIVIVIALILNNAVVFERDESMRKTMRDEL